MCDYVHPNPVRAGLLRLEQSLQAYAWSSYSLYPQEPAQRPVWLRVDRLPGEWGIPADTRPGANSSPAEWSAGGAASTSLFPSGSAQQASLLLRVSPPLRAFCTLICRHARLAGSVYGPG